MEKILDKLLAFIASLLGGVMRIEMVWENPNPTIEFDAQSISVDLTECKFVLFEYKHSKNSSARMCALIRMGCTSHIQYVDVYADLSTTFTACSRIITINKNGVSVGAGAFRPATTNTYTENNTIIIPSRVYGIKRIGG